MLAVLLLSGILCLWTPSAAAEEKATRPQYWPLLINGYAYPKMELALTAAEQARGLMFREQIPNDGGMIFVFPESSRRSFWMKNTLVPLDLIFLDDESKVVAIHHMQPEMPRLNHEDDYDYGERLKHYDSKQKARVAIEWAAGQADLCGIRVGEQLEIGLAELCALAAKHAAKD